MEYQVNARLVTAQTAISIEQHNVGKGGRVRLPIAMPPKANVHGKFCVHEEFDVDKAEMVECGKLVPASLKGKHGWLCPEHYSKQQRGRVKVVSNERVH